jgi:hypothetical protein
LTGIAAAAEAERDAAPDIVALISVGAVTPAQLDILLHRLAWTFPKSQIVIGYWEKGGERLQQDGDDAEGIRYAKSVASLIDLVGRKAHSQFHSVESVR